MFRNPTTDMIIVLVIVLLFLGPKRLPGLGKSLGQGMREFKDGITGDSKPEDDEKPAIARATPTPDPVAGAAVPTEHAAPAPGSADLGSEHRS